ncbi:MAG: hypothetical protein JWO60_734 [Frankiales bacterium]|nr:hypothetical protein [Frankiales bacterium]
MTTTQTDSLVLAAVVGGVLLVVAVVAAVRRLLAPLALLPEADRAPSGLGRLVPTGAQVDAECRRGLRELEDWMVALRRATP